MSCFSESSHCLKRHDLLAAINKTWAVLWPDATAVPLREKLLSALGVFTALFLSAAITPVLFSTANTPMLVASMGASTILIFAFPASPFAQPWPFIAGNIVSAMVAILCVHVMPHTVLAEALIVGLAVLAMFMLRCLHPPGGATALALALASTPEHLPGMQFLLAPLAANIIIVLGCAFMINNLLPGRHYPARRSPPSPHLSSDPPPLQRAGVASEDIRYALQQFPRPLDVSGEEVETLLQLAEARAFRQRLPDILCGEIMSRDVITVQADADLDALWVTLKRHKVGAIPVVDDQHRLLGIVTLVDILTRGNFRRNQGFAKSTGDVEGDGGKTAQDVMAHPVVAVKVTDHVVEVVPLLSDRGYHHVPVVDEQHCVVGMISQSDLIATLYRSR